ASCYERLAPLQAARAPIAFLAMIRHRIHLAREPRPGLRLLLKRWFWVGRCWVIQFGAYHRFTSLFGRSSTAGKSDHAETDAAYHASSRHLIFAAAIHLSQFFPHARVPRSGNRSRFAPPQI